MRDIKEKIQRIKDYRKKGLLTDKEFLRMARKIINEHYQSNKNG